MTRESAIAIAPFELPGDRTALEAHAAALSTGGAVSRYASQPSVWPRSAWSQRGRGRAFRTCLTQATSRPAGGKLIINANHALTVTSPLAVFGTGGLIMPGLMARYWNTAPTGVLDYMARRYGAVLIGLGVTVWLARNALNTQARRALMIGALVALVPTTALSLYGALALGLNAWPPFAVELVMTVGIAWVLFIKPGPVT